MSNDVRKLIIEGDVSGASAAVAQLDGQVDGLGTPIKKATTGLGGFIAKGAALGGMAFGFEALGGAVGQVKQALDQASASAIKNQGISQGLEISITGARAALGGLVTDQQIAQKAQQAYMLGAVENSQEFTALSAGIAVLAAKQGADVGQMLDEGVSAIARGSTEMLDNIGVTLDTVEAQEIYADSLGKTVEELNASEKAGALQKAMLIKISAAAKEAAASNSNAARAYAQSQVAIDNLRNSALGLDDGMAKAKEAVRGLTDEELRYLENSDSREADRLDVIDALKRQAQAQADLTNEMLGTSLAASAFQATWKDITALGEVDDLVAQERERRRLQALDVQALADKEAHEKKIKAIEDEAGEIEHMAELVQASGAEQEAVNAQIRQALTLRMEAAKLAGDETEQLRIQRELEVMAVAAEAKKARRGGGGGKGPTAADKLAAAGEIQLQEWADRLKLMELDASLIFDDAIEFGDKRHKLAVDELNLEREVLAITKGKTQIDRERNEARIIAIDREIEILDLEKQISDATIARDLEQGADEEKLAAMDREIERLQALGIATQILEQQRDTAQRNSIARYGTEEELRQFDHEKGIEEIDRRRQLRIDEADENLAAFEREVELTDARGQVYRDETDTRLALLQQVAAAEGDQAKVRELAHKREVNRLKERKKVFAEVQSSTNAVMSQGQSLFDAVAGAHIKNEEKRAKATMKFNGVMAMARGALEIVEAVAAFAKYDFVGGALHIAASVTAFATGASLLAGNVPTSAGGGASMGSGGSFTPSYEGGDSGNSRDRPTTPASAEELTRIRGGYGAGSSTSAASGSGGNVTNINNSGIIVTGDSGYLVEEVDRSNRKAWGS
jgi:hypothetical protein